MSPGRARTEACAGAADAVGPVASTAAVIAASVIASLARPVRRAGREIVIVLLSPFRIVRACVPALHVGVAIPLFDDPAGRQGVRRHRHGKHRHGPSRPRAAQASITR
jgi:hypothetical protein